MLLAELVGVVGGLAVTARSAGLAQKWVELKRSPVMAARPGGC